MIRFGVPTIEPCEFGLLYDDDAYVERTSRREPSTDGGASGLMGRQVAGKEFLAAFLEFGDWEELVALVRHPDATRSLEILLADHSSTRSRRIRLVLEREFPDILAQTPPSRVIHLPTPLDSRFAWARQAQSPGGFCLSGLTHTLCDPAAIRQLCELITAPFQPYDTLICTSQAVLETVRNVTTAYGNFLRERFGGSSGVQPRLEVIPLGVDVRKFHPASPEQRRACRRTLEVREEEVCLLFVGRLVHHAKAHPFPLLRAVDWAAIATGKSLHLILCGWSPNEAIARAFRDGVAAFAPNARVSFVDGMDASIRSQVWGAADLFVSLVDNIQETFGLAVLEAMACGLPVVASDWGGYRDLVVPGETGLLVPTSMVTGASGSMMARLVFGVLDYDHFLAESTQTTAVCVPDAADALIRLVADEPLRRSLGEAGRRRAVERFAWSRVIAAYETLWRDQERQRRMFAASRSLAPVPSIYPPPEVAFAGYPTRWITGTGPELFEAVDDAEANVSRLLEMPLTNHVADHRCSDLVVLRMLLAELGTPRVAAHIENFLANAGHPGAVGRATLGWMLKYDLIRLVKPPFGPKIGS